MTQSSHRLTCAQCGANNFDTVTVCWKCGAALRASGGSRPAATPNGSASAPLHYSSGASSGALRAALWLGLLFPYVGLPVGLIFIMLDDAGRAEVGRACVLWSCVSLAAHVIIMMLIGVGMREVLFAALQGVRGAADRAGGMGGYGAPGF